MDGFNKRKGPLTVKYENIGIAFALAWHFTTVILLTQDFILK